MAGCMAGLKQGSVLVRADSWSQNVAGAALIKHLSDASLEAGNMGGLEATLDAAKLPKTLLHPLHRQLPAPAKANSTDSTSTAHRSGAQQDTQASLTQHSFLGPLRQLSLDVLAATELRAAAAQPLPERQNIFQDVLEQLAQREELPPTGIFPMPSIQFLESLLDDLGQQAPGGGAAGPIDLPLNLPPDAFDLDFRPTPFDQAVQPPAQQQQQMQHLHPSQQQLMPGQQQTLPPPRLQRGSSGLIYHLHAAALAQHTIAPPAPLAPAYLQQLPPGMVPAAAAAAVQQQQHLQQQPRPLTAFARGGLASMPLPEMQHTLSSVHKRAPTRRVQSAYEPIAYDDADVSIQTSKSGRVRKVATFTGNKRKSMGEGHSAPSALPRHMVAEMHNNTASESHDSWNSAGEDSGSEASKGSKGSRGRRGKKNKRTTCLNCGCHQTPQWRCGPLGPRTLCNACGVRYKKGLPLNCWPLRDGMTLPAGAELPQSVKDQIPPHWTIHYAPAPAESG